METITITKTETTVKEVPVTIELPFYSKDESTYPDWYMIKGTKEGETKKVRIYSDELAAIDNCLKYQDAANCDPCTAADFEAALNQAKQILGI
jgi:hypothetical protein